MAKNLDIVGLIDAYAPALTEKQREMMEFYYYDDLSLAEIAENSGISRQGVRDAIKRGETTVLELEEKLGYAKRRRALSEQLARIRANVQEIVVVNETFTYSDRIRAAADEIVAALDEAENALITEENDSGV